MCVKGKQSFSNTAEWNPLSEGWVKLKINGCFLGNLVQSGIRGIFSFYSFFSQIMHFEI